jgi:hypothetical protein
MSTAEATNVRTLLEDYAAHPGLMPDTASVALTLVASDGWKQTIQFGSGTNSVTCRIDQDALAEMLVGQSSEVSLLASGQMALIGSSSAVNALFDVLPALGLVLAGDLEMGGHRFVNIRSAKPSPEGCPDQYRDEISDQLWVAGLLIARLSRTCQVAELEQLIPHSSKLDFPGVQSWEDLTAPIFACVAAGSTTGRSNPAAGAAAGIDDPNNAWRTSVVSAASAKRPLRAVAAALDDIEPVATTPSAR